MADRSFQLLSLEDQRDALGCWIDYEAAVTGGLQLVPHGLAYEPLADDYAKMLSDGMLLDDEEQFADLMERVAEIEVRANQR